MDYFVVIGSHPLRITFRKFKHLNINFFGTNDKIVFRGRSANEMEFDSQLDAEYKSSIFIGGSEYYYVPKGEPSTAFSSGGYPFYFSQSATDNSFLFQTLINDYFLS